MRAMGLSVLERAGWLALQGTLRPRRTGSPSLEPFVWPQPNDICVVAGTATTLIAPRPARTPATGAVVSFAGVEMRYSATDTALAGISFDIYPGEFVFLVGHSGSGKSTAMRLLIKESSRPPARSASPAATCRRSRVSVCRTTAATSA